MTIKKPKMTTATEPVADVPPMPAAGGATIADRFKLDMTDAPKAKSSGGVGDKIALIAAVVALGVVGVLTFVIYQHWEFFQNA